MKKGMSAEEWSKAGSFMRKPDRGWLHSDQAIKDGGVCYALKYLGCIEVLKSMRTLQYDIRQHATKEAMYRCCEANGYKFSKRKKAHKNVVKLLADHPRTSHSGTFISLTVSVSGIVLTDMASGEVISKHDMQGISFASGGEKDCPDIVGYVAKDAKNRRACHVLDCPQNLSYDVINTIGQAFELRYKMFLDDPPQLLTTPRRFVDPIFGEEDKTMENTYDDPRDEGVFPDPHEYDSVNDSRRIPSDNEDDSPHEYQTPRLHEAPCEMSKYDTPNATLEASTGPDYFQIEESSEKNASLEFTVGTQFDTAAAGPPVTTPSYHNPLAVITNADNRDNLYDNPGMKVSSLAKATNGGGSLMNNWETFEEAAVSAALPVLVPVAAPRAKSRENISASPPPIADHTSPLHNTLGYALPLPRKPVEQVSRKTPPPLPKPYARIKIGDDAETTLEDTPAASMNDLSGNVWFHGPLSRQEAENLLSRDGDFLVRESTTNPGQYVLSGQQNGYPKHLLLVDPSGVVRTLDQSFDSVGHLVRYHQDNRIPIISSGSVLILRQSVVKKNSNHPLYDLPV